MTTLVPNFSYNFIFSIERKKTLEKYIEFTQNENVLNGQMILINKNIKVSASHSQMLHCFSIFRCKTTTNIQTEKKKSYVLTRCTVLALQMTARFVDLPRR